MATFEFNNQFVPQSLIDIENIGQFAIEANNDEGYYWYLIVSTLLGTVTIASAGPVVPDVALLPGGYACSFYTMEYKEPKLEKAINTWLNDKGKALTEARVVDIDVALDEFRDLSEYLRSEVLGNYDKNRN